MVLVEGGMSCGLLRHGACHFCRVTWRFERASKVRLSHRQFYCIILTVIFSLRHGFYFQEHEQHIEALVIQEGSLLFKEEAPDALFAAESTGTSFCSLNSISSLLTFRT